MSPGKTPSQRSDEVINVTLSKADYEILRKMIEREQAASWLWQWTRHFLFVAIGGLVALFTFGQQIRDLIISILHK